jgi:DNA-binding response OmpR family regulator
VVDTEPTRDLPVRAQLVEQRGPAASQVFLLQGSITRIGRYPDNDIVLPSPSVSRYHAELRYAAGHYVLYDLGSRNGTDVNGVAVQAPYPLRQGDRITIGELVLVFQTDETIDARAALRTSATLRVDPASAQVWVGAQLVHVSAQEYRALVLLASRPGQLVSKDDLVAQVWPEYGGAVSDETVGQLIARLRRKLEPDPSHPQYLFTVRKLGYRLLTGDSSAS